MIRSKRSRTPGRLALACAVLWALIGLPALAQDGSDYAVRSGDTLRFSITGVARMDEAAPVDLDGAIRLPLVGTVQADGRSLVDLEEEVKRRLVGATVQVAATGGALLEIPIRPDAVTLQVLEYRPVYVLGAVRSPGAFPFEPGLTVRRALAMAGGIGGADVPDPEGQAVRLRGERAVLDERIEAEEDLIARLQAELADRSAASGPEGDAPDPDGIGGARRSAVAELLAAEDRLAREELRLAGRRYAALEEQLAVETEGEAADAEDYARLEELAENGRITADRLSMARRTLLASSSRRLATAAEAARVEREISAIRDRSNALRREYDLEALEALEAATARRAALEAERRAVAAELRHVGSLAPEGAEPPHIVVRRADGSDIEVHPGTDPPLAPGDLTEVEFAP